MTRVAGILFFLTAAGAALFLFHIKQEVREMEEELGIVHSNILRHQEAIQVLRTEWSYLNRPARIAELAERYLDMQQLTGLFADGLDHLGMAVSDPADGPSGEHIQDLIAVKIPERIVLALRNDFR